MSAVDLSNLSSSSEFYAVTEQILRENLSKEPSHAVFLAQKRIKESLYFATQEQADTCQDIAERKAIKKSPLGMLRACRYLQNSIPFIRREAEDARDKLEAYCQEIISALKASGADTSNQVLMEHIVGPKNYMFSHYGIVISNETHDGIPWFYHVPIHENSTITHRGPHIPQTKRLQFLLKKDTTPAELEKEIRAKILEAHDLEEETPLEGMPEEPVYYCRSRELYCILDFPPPPGLIPYYDQEKLEEAADDAANSQPPSIRGEDALREDTGADLRDALAQAATLIYFRNPDEARQWLDKHPEPEALKKYKKTPQALYFASKHVNLNDQTIHPKIQLEALKASRQFNAYAEAIKSALIRGGAAMNETLLQHIIGPDDFLFSKYGIVPKNNYSDPKKKFCMIPAARGTCINIEGRHVPYPNTNNPANVGYLLDNPTPEALEKQISDDIAKVNKSLRR